MREDATLIARIVDGDEDALRLLYERHADFVFTLAHDALGDRAGALDVLQETFLDAVRQLHSEGPPPAEEEESTADPAFRRRLERLVAEEIDRRRHRLHRSREEGGSAAPSPLTIPERELAFGWIRRQWAADPWRGLWKWVVAVAVLLLLYGLWQLHRTAGAGAGP